MQTAALFVKQLQTPKQNYQNFYAIYCKSDTSKNIEAFY